MRSKPILFRQQFSLDPDLIYLNSGTFSISPNSVLHAQGTYERDFERNPTQALISAWGRLWMLQKQLAEFFHTAPENLFLRPNVTSALNDFILSIPLPKNAELLVTDLEYGAIVNLCRFRAERDRLTLRAICLNTPAANDPDPKQNLVDQILRQLSSKSALLMLSHVTTGTGLIVPIAELSAELRRRGVLLVVDGAHGPGALPLDFRLLTELDFYGGNLHKWFLGPKGTAFGWVNPRHHEALVPRFAGWTTYEPTVASFRDFAPDHVFARRMLHSACQNFGPYFALEATLSFWKQSGEASVFSELKRLQARLEELLRDQMGWETISPLHPELRGPLLSYALPELSMTEAATLFEDLLAKHNLQVGIPTVKGIPCLRFSPHIYNTENELERAVKIISQVL